MINGGTSYPAVSVRQMEGVCIQAPRPRGTNVSVTLSLGSSRSDSTTQGESVTRSGSELLAGGNIRLTAEGGGDDSNILVRGSRISASENVYLTADNDIHLLAGEMTDEQRTRSSSSSAGVGLSASWGSDGAAVGVYIEGSAGRGKADGSDLVHNNTQIQAGNDVHFSSGGDTLLRGAVIEGERVVGRVGGDLLIESLQDLSSYSSQNRHIGGSATIGAGFSAQGSASSQKINSDYASVGQQSAIRAGDGGFDIEVEGTTRLIGGAITSTDAAVEADVNRFNQNTEEGLARLEMSDIQNHADYKGSGFSVSGGVSAPSTTAPTSAQAPGTDASATEGSTQSQQTSAQVMHGSGGSHQSAGVGRVKGSDGSITESGISGLAGNADLRTGDAETGIDQIFDLNQVQNELDTSIMVTAEFGRVSSQAWGDYASNKEAQLWLEAQNEGDPDIRADLEAEASRWSEGGIYRISGHTLIGLAGGGVDGATGALTSSVVMPEVARLTAEMDLPNGVRQGLESVVAGLIGTVAGNSSGGAMGFNIDTNNRQLHSFEQSLAELLAVESEYSPEQIADALRAMYNDELGEAPNANIIVNIQDPDAGDLSPAHGDMIVDEGGTWIYANGNYIQSVPRDIDPVLVAYIVSQTGGEESPYRMPVHVTGTYDPVRQHLFPGSIALAAGFSDNLNMPDLRTQDEIDAGQDRLTTTMSHMVALPVSGTYALANLGVKGATYVLLTGGSVGGGFNAAGQWVQNGEIRPGEVLISSYTGAVAAPFAGASMLFNGMLGSYIGGTNAALTNEWFNESRNVGQAATEGFVFAWLGTYAGKGIADQAKIILPSHVGGKIIDPKIPILLQNYGVQNPWPNYLGNTVEQGVSNLPSFYSSSDTGGE